MRAYSMRGFLWYPAPMFKGGIILLCLIGLPAHAAGQGYYLDEKTWAQPRSGEVVMQMDALGDAVRELAESTDSVLRIHYPGGDEGSLWAHELQGWLVALGVSSERIVLLPGSARADAIYLRVVKAAVVPGQR